MRSSIVSLISLFGLTLALYYPKSASEYIPHLSMLTSPCDNSAEMKITKCAEELSSIGVFSQNSSLTINEMRTKSQRHLILMCTAYRRYNECLGGTFIKQACYPMEPLKSRYAVADATLDFICGEGFDAMVHNWECYMSVSASFEIAQCETSFGRVSSRQEQMYTEYNPGSAACFALQTYVDCIRPSIEMSCGISAFENVVKAIEKPVQVYLPHCTLSSSNAAPGLVIMLLLVYALSD